MKHGRSMPLQSHRAGGDHDELRQPIGAASVFLKGDEENAGHGFCDREV